MAFTNSIVIGYLALSIDTTRSWAGVLTLGVDAGLVLWTVKTEETLWLASYERISLVISDTLADSLARLLPALSVSTTRTRVARVLRSRGLRHYGLLGAAREGISYSSRWTTTDRVVVLNLTECEHSACAGTRVYTLLSYTGKGPGTV